MIGWLRSRFARTADRALAEAERAYADGALDAARSACTQVLRAVPEHPRALFLLACAAADQSLIDEGLMWSRRALNANPGQAAPHYAMGRVLEAAGRYADAEASYRQAVMLDPRDAKLHNNLGAMLHMQGRFDAALACYRKALELDPELAQAKRNLATIADDPEALQSALDGYRRETEQHPRQAAAWRGLADIHASLGRTDEALASYDRAVALEPDNAAAHFGRAFALLSRGDYAEGWKEYDWRWRIEGLDAPMRRFAQPAWRGDPSPDATILLHGETGLGDMLQFIRYAPLVAARCGKVIVECAATLLPLVERIEGVSATVAQGERLPAFDAHSPVIALPGVFGTTLDSIPWDGAYVRADPARVAEWRSQLSSPAFKVGLVWKGNPAHLNDRKRSASLAAFLPLRDVPGVELYSLQKGAGADEAAAPPPGLRLTDLGPRLRDFSDTAAVASLLDVVVTVDSSVAHLGGAMAVPTWVLIAHAPDWRFHFHIGDRHSPWYPGMRLFRQPRAGDWAAVLAEVADELRAAARNGSASRRGR